MTSAGDPLDTASDFLLTPDYVSAADALELRQALRALCPDWDVSRVQVEHFLVGGYSNRNYRICYADQRFVLRLPGSESTTDFMAELALLDALQSTFSANSSSSPQMQLAETMAARPVNGWLLTRWVEQPVLAGIADVSAEQLGAYLAALHLRLQDLPAVPPRRSATHSTEANATGGLIDSIMADMTLVITEPAIAPRLRQYLAQIAAAVSSAQPCHVDLNPWNLLFDGAQSWVTLDWETLDQAPPLFDLVVLCDGYALNQGYDAEQTLQLALRCLGIYNSLMHAEYSLAELNSLRTLFRWREYAWAAARLQEGALRDAVVADVLAQRRAYAALLREEAKRLQIELVFD